MNCMLDVIEKVNEEVEFQFRNGGNQLMELQKEQIELTMKLLDIQLKALVQLRSTIN